MRSAFRIGNHPLHPILLPFPLAFLTGAFGFDLGARLLERPAWGSTALHLIAAGLVTGVLAAIPGVVDYLRVLPPNSTGKTRATRHGLTNSTALALFGIALLLRDGGGIADWSVLALEAAGTAVLMSGAWMGGTLVVRNQIGIDHRYAEAGKWSEARITARAGQPVRVARSDELVINQMKLLHVNGRRIVLGRTEDGYVAFDDRCTHRGASLADGVMICGTVQCPWHGSQFRTDSGLVSAGPAGLEIATYRTEERDGEVHLTL
jgi:nitrite reductase/ring-hydroxylating ferredoxin subunit/uncharacterized membrane protein